MKKDHDAGLKIAPEEYKRSEFWMALAKVCLRMAGCNPYDIEKALEEV